MLIRVRQGRSTKMCNSKPLAKAPFTRSLHDVLWLVYHLVVLLEEIYVYLYILVFYINYIN
jgi:hypothetical protein